MQARGPAEQRRQQDAQPSSALSNSPSGTSVPTAITEPGMA